MIKFEAREESLAQPTGPKGGAAPPPRGSGPLDPRLCQVVGLNRNYTSASGTPYHIQIEDRGPVVDRVTEESVRRVNLVIYANYGEANARILYGQDHDFPDVRSQEYNRFIEQQIQEIAGQAKAVIEEREQREVFRIKCLIRDYYRTRDEAAKKEFEEANTLFPFLFSRAWRELKAQKVADVEPEPRELPPKELPPEEEQRAEEVFYPLDPELREHVIEIERMVIELGQDLQRLRAQGNADDILLQTCRKLVSRAKESLSGREPSEFNARRLDMTRNSLLTTWRQVKSRLKT